MSNNNNTNNENNKKKNIKDEFLLIFKYKEKLYQYQ